MRKALIIIPTYNEILNIESLLDLVFKETEKISDTSIHVLVIDDNSPDKTGEKVEELILNKYPNTLFQIKRSGKLGLGTAYITGFKWAIEKKYDLIFEMDADFSHHPRYIIDFLKASETNDLVIGSRYVKGGGVVNWTFTRKLISRGGSLYSKIILNLPINDITGGFKCFKRELLEKLDLEKIVSNGYSFQIELNYRAYLKKAKILEIPIIFEDRVDGVSKMSKTIFREAIWKVLLLRTLKGKILKNLA